MSYTNMSIVYDVDSWNNFCRVFELPKSFSDDYCFNGGHPTNFQMVDWFYPVSQEEVPIAAVSKNVWRKEVGKIEVKQYEHQYFIDNLIPFLRKKSYSKRGRKYLVLCDFGASFVYEGL